MLKFEQNRTVAEPKDAATLLVLRDAADTGFEVFFVRRHAQSAFMGGAVVFPGGKLDEADLAWAASAKLRTTGMHPRATDFANNQTHAIGLAVCACREALEEAGLMPTQPPLDATATDRLREPLEAGEPLDTLLEREAPGCKLDTAALVPFGRWITPEAEQRRYDARFYLTVLPTGQVGRHDERETTSGVWAHPERMLEAHFAGDIFLPPPTLRVLELLRHVSDSEAALALCEQQSLLPVCPKFVPGDPPFLAIPGDPEHDIAQRHVAGPTRFVLRDAKFLSEDPPEPTT